MAQAALRKMQPDRFLNRRGEIVELELPLADIEVTSAPIPGDLAIDPTTPANSLMMRPVLGSWALVVRNRSAPELLQGIQGVLIEIAYVHSEP